MQWTFPERKKCMIKNAASYKGKTKNSSTQQHRTRYKWCIATALLLWLLATVLIIVTQKTQPGDELPKLVPESIPPDASQDLTLSLDQENEVPAEDAPWYLTLVNRQNPIPEDYEVNLVKVEGGEKVDERIYEPLMEMLEAAREGNLGQLPMVVSGYRTQKKQQQLYDDKIAKYRRQGYSKEEARKLAEQLVAVPGYSEHQLGFAVDINGATYDVYLWLQENSYKYGFIFRYPGSKTEITGTAEEVWHYRYVGPEAAAEIYEQGLCLEEYLEAVSEQL